MSIKFSIFAISVIITVVFGAEIEIEVDSSSTSISEESPELDYNDLTSEDNLFRNLKELLRNGDDEFGLPVWAPYVDDNVLVE